MIGGGDFLGQIKTDSAADDDGDGLAAADAQARHAGLFVEPAQLVDERRQDARARAADRVTDRDRAADDAPRAFAEGSDLKMG